MSPNTGELKMASGKRANKPLMEKKRRERINGCLGQLKTLVMESLHQEGASHTKLEKADILEMTVKYLEDHKIRTGGRAPPTADSRTSYREGYHACVTDMTSFLRSSEANASFRTRLLQHMGNRLDELNPETTNVESQKLTHSEYNDENVRPMDFVDGVTSESSNDSTTRVSPHKIKFEVLGNIPLQAMDDRSSSPLRTSQTENVRASLVTSETLVTSRPSTVTSTVNDSGIRLIQATQIGNNVIVLPQNNLQQGQYRILQIQNHSSQNNVPIFGQTNGQIFGQTNGQIFGQNGGLVQPIISTQIADERIALPEGNLPQTQVLSQALPSINTFSSFQNSASTNHVTDDVTYGRVSTNQAPTYTVLQPMRRENVESGNINGGFYGHYDQEENVWRPWSKSGF